MKNFNELRKRLSGTADFIEKHAFFIFFVLLFLSFLLAGIIFYQYGYKASYTNPEVTVKEIKIDNQLYEKIISHLEESQKRLKEAENKSYPDPFR